MTLRKRQVSYKKMITEYGMSKKFGLLNLEELDVKPDVILEDLSEITKML